MGTNRRAVEMPTEKTVGDNVLDEDMTFDSPGRGPRPDGTDQIPDRQLDIRDR